MFSYTKSRTVNQSIKVTYVFHLYKNETFILNIHISIPLLCILTWCSDCGDETKS